METTIAGLRVTLLPQKALWINGEKTIIIADVHLGKIEHFRSAGIGMPRKATSNALSALENIIHIKQPLKVIFLGDLFHSKKNSSFDEFKTFTARYSAIKFILVKGNHDIMTDDLYAELNLQLIDEYFINSIWLTHEPQEEIRAGLYNLAGHIHPAIRLKGLGRQRLTLPCFYFGKNHGILPAFGYFTGKSVIKVEKKSSIFAVAEENIFEIKTE